VVRVAETLFRTVQQTAKKGVLTASAMLSRNLTDCRPRSCQIRLTRSHAETRRDGLLIITLQGKACSALRKADKGPKDLRAVLGSSPVAGHDAESSCAGRCQKRDSGGHCWTCLLRTRLEVDMVAKERHDG